VNFDDFGVDTGVGLAARHDHNQRFESSEAAQRPPIPGPLSPVPIQLGALAPTVLARRYPGHPPESATEVGSVPVPEEGSDVID